MTSVSLNNTSYDELVKMVGQMQGTGAVAAIKQGELANGVVPLTITLKNGATLNINAELPEVDPSAGGNVDAADQEALTKAVNEMADELPKTSGGTSSLTDLYQVLALLYQTAESQRNAARQTRASEHAVVEASLRGQADKAKTAADEAYAEAKKSAITQAVTAGIAVLGSAASIGLQVKAVKSSPDLKVAKTELNQANADLKVAKDLPKTGVNMKLEDKAAINETYLGKEGSPAQTAKADFIEAKGNVETQTESLEQSKIKVSDANAEVLSDKAKLAEAKKGGDVNQIKAAEDQLALSTEKHKQLKLEVGAKTESLNAAKVDCSEKALAYNAELEKLVKAKPDDQGLKDFVMTEQGAIKGAAVDGCKIKYNAASARVDSAYRSVELSGWMTAAKACDATSQGSLQTGRAVSSFFDAESQHILGIKESEQKTAEAEQESMRAQIDSTNDLCQQEQDLLNFINQMLQQISQAEGNAVEAAIRA